MTASLFVATPSLRSLLTAGYVESIHQLQALCHQQGIGYRLRLLCGISCIDAARNMLSSEFLADDRHSHLLFIDDDIGFNAEDVLRMLEFSLTHPESDVIAAMAPKRKYDWQRLKQIVLAHPDIDANHLAHVAADFSGMFVLPDDSSRLVVSDKPVKVLAIGTGLMLITRSCLQQLLDHDASLVPQQINGTAAPVYAFFHTAPGMGEDFAFCQRVRDAGGLLHGAPWPVVMHTGSHDFIGDLPGLARYL